MSHLEVAQEVGGAIIDINRLEQVWVAVGQVGEHARVVVKITEATIGTARDTDAVPQPCGPQQLVDDIGGAMQLVASVLKQVACLAHIVHLRQPFTSIEPSTGPLHYVSWYKSSIARLILVCTGLHHMLACDTAAQASNSDYRCWLHPDRPRSSLLSTHTCHYTRGENHHGRKAGFSMQTGFCTS